MILTTMHLLLKKAKELSTEQKVQHVNDKYQFKENSINVLKVLTKYLVCMKPNTACKGPFYELIRFWKLPKT